MGQVIGCLMSMPLLALEQASSHFKMLLYHKRLLDSDFDSLQFTSPVEKYTTPLQTDIDTVMSTHLIGWLACTLAYLLDVEVICSYL